MSATEESEQAPQSATYIVSANSAVVFAEANFASDKLATKVHKDKIFVLLDGENPIQENWEGYNFYKISLQENNVESDTTQFGFVLCSLLTLQRPEIVAMPNFNAKTNKECKVFLQQNGAFVESDITLIHGQEIFLYEGFDAKKDFIAISYVLDGSVSYGFLKTDDVSPNGINPLLITCAVLIIAVVSIIFAWLFMKNKHVKLKKQKPGQYNLTKNN